MASIYARGAKLWCRLKGERKAGEWTSVATGFAVGQERQARRFADEAQRSLDARGPRSTGASTLRAFVARWLETRREAGHDWKADRGRLNKHVLGTLGDFELAALRTSHIAALVHRLRFQSEPRLAPRTVRNVYSVLAAALRDAAIAGLIEASPCILTDAQLGSIVDKHPEWRDGAVYTRDEAEVMLSHPGIPLDRRLGYAFGLLAGMRPGEVSALRVRHYDATSEPLGRLVVATAYNAKRAVVKRTKTQTSKAIPVHRTLAELLEQWLAFGWEAMMGRAPMPDDLLLPLPPETLARRTVHRDLEPYRGYNYSSRRWREIDLPLLGWRPRSLYDTKSTFVTLAIEDGADPAIIRDRVTHTKQKRTAFDGYDRGPHWIATCAEVAKLRISLRSPSSFATARATTAKDANDLAAMRCSEGGFRTPASVRTRCDELIQVLRLTASADRDASPSAPESTSDVARLATWNGER